MKFNSLVLISLATLAVSKEANIINTNQDEITFKKQLDSRGLGLKDFITDHLPWSGKKHWKDHDGKEHWNDKDGKEHWKDHDGKVYKPPVAMKRSDLEILH